MMWHGRSRRDTGEDAAVEMKSLRRTEFPRAESSTPDDEVPVSVVTAEPQSSKAGAVPDRYDDAETPEETAVREPVTVFTTPELRKINDTCLVGLFNRAAITISEEDLEKIKITLVGGGIDQRAEALLALYLAGKKVLRHALVAQENVVTVLTSCISHGRKNKQDAFRSIVCVFPYLFYAWKLPDQCPIVVQFMKETYSSSDTDTAFQNFIQNFQLWMLSVSDSWTGVFLSTGMVLMLDRLVKKNVGLEHADIISAFASQILTTLFLQTNISEETRDYVNQVLTSIAEKYALSEQRAKIDSAMLGFLVVSEQDAFQQRALERLEHLDNLLWFRNNPRAANRIFEQLTGPVYLCSENSARRDQMLNLLLNLFNSLEFTYALRCKVIPIFADLLKQDNLEIKCKTVYLLRTVMEPSVMREDILLLVEQLGLAKQKCTDFRAEESAADCSVLLTSPELKIQKETLIILNHLASYSGEYCRSIADSGAVVKLLNQLAVLGNVNEAWRVYHDIFNETFLLMTHLTNKNCCDPVCWSLLLESVLNYINKYRDENSTFILLGYLEKIIKQVSTRDFEKIQETLKGIIRNFGRTSQVRKFAGKLLKSLGQGALEHQLKALYMCHQRCILALGNGGEDFHSAASRETVIKIASDMRLSPEAVTQVFLETGDDDVRAEAMLLLHLMGRKLSNAKTWVKQLLKTHLPMITSDRFELFYLDSETLPEQERFHSLRIFANILPYISHVDPVLSDKSVSVITGNLFRLLWRLTWALSFNFPDDRFTNIIFILMYLKERKINQALLTYVGNCIDEMNSINASRRLGRFRQKRAFIHVLFFARATMPLLMSVLASEKYSEKDKVWGLCFLTELFDVDQLSMKVRSKEINFLLNCIIENNGVLILSSFLVQQHRDSAVYLAVLSILSKLTFYSKEGSRRLLFEANILSKLKTLWDFEDFEAEQIRDEILDILLNMASFHSEAIVNNGFVELLLKSFNQRSYLMSYTVIERTLEVLAHRTRDHPAWKVYIPLIIDLFKRPVTTALVPKLLIPLADDWGEKILEELTRKKVTRNLLWLLDASDSHIQTQVQMAVNGLMRHMQLKPALQRIYLPAIMLPLCQVYNAVQSDSVYYTCLRDFFFILENAAAFNLSDRKCVFEMICLLNNTLKLYKSHVAIVDHALIILNKLLEHYIVSGALADQLAMSLKHLSRFCVVDRGDQALSERCVSVLKKLHRFSGISPFASVEDIGAYSKNAPGLVQALKSSSIEEKQNAAQLLLNLIARGNRYGANKVIDDEQCDAVLTAGILPVLITLFESSSIFVDENFSFQIAEILTFLMMNAPERCAVIVNSGIIMKFLQQLVKLTGEDVLDSYRFYHTALSSIKKLLDQLEKNKHGEASVYQSMLLNNMLCYIKLYCGKKTSFDEKEPSHDLMFTLLYFLEDRIKKDQGEDLTRKINLVLRQVIETFSGNDSVVRLASKIVNPEICKSASVLISLPAAFYPRDRVISDEPPEPDETGGVSEWKPSR